MTNLLTGHEDFILAFDGSFWITGVQDDPYDNIIAWKEIVPPKEIKENDI